MTNREKFLFLATHLAQSLPRGLHLEGDPGLMDDETLFVFVLLGLTLLYVQLPDNGGSFAVVSEGSETIPLPSPVDTGGGGTQPPSSHAGGRGTVDDVARAINDLSAAGRDLSGPCGAFAICNLVAWRLRPDYGLLRKTGGNRAVPQADGGCQSGDFVNDPGFATDYLIDRATGYGYDLLGDGGGANNPQWNGPETDPVFVKRNFDNFTEPMDPGL